MNEPTKGLQFPSRIAKRWEQAQASEQADVLIDLFHHWHDLNFERLITTSADPDVTQFFNDLTKVLVEFLEDPHGEIRKEQFYQLAAFRDLIDHCFYLNTLYPLDATADKIRTWATPNHDRVMFQRHADLYKYLLIISPQSNRCIDDLIVMARDQSQVIHLVYLQCLASRITGDATVQHNRQRLMEHLNVLDTVRLNRFSLHVAHQLWAVSSYDNPESNYRIKDFLNKKLRDWIRDQEYSINPKIRHLNLSEINNIRKPRLLIAAETLQHHHVMFRCFGRPIKALSDHFYVIVLTPEEDLGNEEWDWCDDLFTFKQKKFALNIEVDRIQQLSPDVVLYPSIGMRLWCLLLSRIRIAPLQLCLMGHPDSPHANEIDHCLLGSSLVDPSLKFPGNLVVLKSPGSLFDFSYDPPLPPASPNEGTSIRIAVCANIFKLSVPFLSACRKIADHTHREISFHFMQNLNGTHFQLGKRQIENILEGIPTDVYPVMRKPAYFELLGSCDVFLSPFPFGGENSTLDALLMGLPVLTLTGPHPMNRLDYRVLQSLPLPEVLFAKSEEEYITNAIQILENDALRAELRQLIHDEQPRTIFETQTKEFENELSEVVLELYSEMISKRS